MQHIYSFTAYGAWDLRQSIFRSHTLQSYHYDLALAISRAMAVTNRQTIMAASNAMRAVK